MSLLVLHGVYNLISQMPGYQQENKTRVKQSYNTSILVLDITQQGLQMQTKREPEGSHQVNSKNTRQFNIIYSGLIDWMDCMHALKNDI